MSGMSELAGRGYRRTTQRAVILDILEGASGHMTAEEVSRQVEASGVALNRSTVYRTLETLAEIGVVRATRIGRALHYEVSRERHHHLRCVRCHGTVDLDAGQVDRLLGRLAADQDFEVMDLQVLISGVCRTCRSSHKRAN